MVTAHTVFGTGPAFSYDSSSITRRFHRAKMPFFQAFLRPSLIQCTDVHCIKDVTIIDTAPLIRNFLLPRVPGNTTALAGKGGVFSKTKIKAVLGLSNRRKNDYNYNLFLCIRAGIRVLPSHGSPRQTAPSHIIGLLRNCFLGLLYNLKLNMDCSFSAPMCYTRKVRRDAKADFLVIFLCGKIF